MGIKIKSRFDTEEILFESEAKSLRSANLRNANLYGANLRSADLYGADLRSANLYGADLRSANLGGADLRSANLGGADLYGADLRSANLGGADLGGAYLYGADLYGADLGGANLGGADLGGANLRGANLGSANLGGANLRGANLGGANLGGANLRGAYLRSADLGGANLYGAALPDYLIVPEEGAFIGFKKTADGTILKLEIPADAKRVGGLIGRKCRASAAKVLEAFGDKKELGKWVPGYRSEFYYTLGEVASVKDFCDDIRLECAAGIHFFLTRAEAEKYDG